MNYVEFDPDRGVLGLSNVSFYSPILRRQDGSLVWLGTRNQPYLGAATGYPFAEAQHFLGPGDSLLLYSEGAIRALDPFGMLFGENRLPAIWKSRGGGASSDAVTAIFAYVRGFRDRALFGGLEGLLGDLVVGRRLLRLPALQHLP